MPPTKLPADAKCFICGNNAIISQLDENKKRTGKYFCKKCYRHDYDHNRRDRKKENKERYLRDRIIGNLKPGSSQAKGDNFEELTVRWRGVKNLNIENDNYTTGTPIDHTSDHELGIVQTKGKFYDPCNDSWLTSLRNEHRAITNGYDFDNLIFYCASENGKIIERIYIFPLEEILARTNIHIIRTIVQGHSLYDKYRVNDKNIVRNVNHIWRKIISYGFENC